MLITKTFTFDAAHQLVGHSGKCANLHGHTYKLEVTVKGDVIDDKDNSSDGMVIDFGDLKEVANFVVGKFDHAVILQGNEQIVPSVDTKFVYTGFRTTAENMARYFLYFMDLLIAEPSIYSVTLWETPTGNATARIDDITIEDRLKFAKVVSGTTNAELMECIGGLTND